MYHCTDTVFGTQNLACRGTGKYLTMVQMVWLIAQRRQESFPSPAVTGRGDHPDIGTWVCDGLRQMHIAMEQHCMGGSRYALFTGYGGLNQACKLRGKVR